MKSALIPAFFSILALAVTTVARADDPEIKTYGDSLNAVVVRQSPSASDAPRPMGSEVTLYLSAEAKKQN